MAPVTLNRRAVVTTIATSTFLGRLASAQSAKPVALNIVDGAGTLAMVQPSIEAFRKTRPDLVSRVAYSKATQPELPGKLRAQQNGGRVDIDLVLCGYDGLTAGFAQDVWLDLFPRYEASLPRLDEILLPGAWMIQQQTHGQGVCIAFSPYGPLLEYMPDRVRHPPTTAAELLDWCRQNKGRFFYARPANSGPARALMVGLPYILGDADPRDPVRGWDRTWTFLKALDETIDYYPTGTAAVFKELGDGSRDLVPSTTGWDINPRALGIVPAEAKIATLKGFHWVSDAHVACIPKGVADEKVPVLLELIRFILVPAQQANNYSDGSFYPGPAVRDVPLSMAPEKSQRTIAEFGRPEYAELIATVPTELPLTPEATVLASRRWDEEIGSRKR